MNIPITFEEVKSADYLATLRENYEYRRSGIKYNYDKKADSNLCIENHFDIELVSKSNIFMGLLFELSLYDFITKKLKDAIINKLPNISDKEFSEKMINFKFSYNMNIGDFDNGYDYIWKVKEKLYKIDCKVYANEVFSDSTYEKYNILVDERQYNSSNTDIYIQGFLVSEKDNLVFRAFFEKKENLRYSDKFPQAGYCKKIEKCKPIVDLINHIIKFAI